ncbi:hypothetical protein NO2_0468 [Candidatus Termititenax persephonae]|uniref:Uncharacterized protein n=1 Tax=Candidatus Termititenax persephonae TaxID=2218525 RepID=A0A388TFK2_9BACT|nr:hypothetical protein NO2_0468 [Candidatus Termititenax persephonae]
MTNELAVQNINLESEAEKIIHAIERGGTLSNGSTSREIVFRPNSTASSDIRITKEIVTQPAADKLRIFLGNKNINATDIKFKVEGSVITLRGFTSRQLEGILQALNLADIAHASKYNLLGHRLLVSVEDVERACELTGNILTLEEKRDYARDKLLNLFTDYGIAVEQVRVVTNGRLKANMIELIDETENNIAKKFLHQVGRVSVYDDRFTSAILVEDIIRMSEERQQRVNAKEELLSILSEYDIDTNKISISTAGNYGYNVIEIFNLNEAASSEYIKVRDVLRNLKIVPVTENDSHTVVIVYDVLEYNVANLPPHKQMSW